MNRIAFRPFGEQLRRFRERAALTQQELAERFRLSTDAISALEWGIRRRACPQTIRLLSSALVLTPEERTALKAAAALSQGIDAGAGDMPRGMESLVRASLVRRVEADSTYRFTLPSPILQVKFDRFLLAAWSAEPEAEGNAEWFEGRAMTPEQVNIYALDDAD